MERRDLVLLEEAARAIICVIERARVQEEDREERILEIRKGLVLTVSTKKHQ